MVRADVLTLIDEMPKAHGILDTYTPVQHDVFCTVKSVSQTEAYQVLALGLTPEYRVSLDHDFEYGGQKLCKLGGIKYRIIRTYMAGEGIELTLARAEGNAV